MRRTLAQRRSAQRGGAVVELAITSVAFVTTLLFGLYFGEVGYMMLKVQEAAHSAMLDATSRRVHKLDLAAVTGNFKGAYQPFLNTKFGHKGAGENAEDEYEDFNGVEDKGKGFSQVMASADDMIAECASTSSAGGTDPLSFDIPNVTSKRAFMNGVENYMTRMYRDRGGVRCMSSASVHAINFPRAFLENGGPMTKTKLFLASSLTLPVCGVGLAKNGKCKGELAVLTGDWAIDAELNNNANRDVIQMPTGFMKPGGNQAYRQIIKDLYALNGDGGQKNGAGRTAAQELMITGGGFAVKDVTDQYGKYNERRFLMSDSGAESNYEQELQKGIAAQKKDVWYNTSGVDLASTSNNPNKRGPKAMKYARCFLGIGKHGCKPPP
jgi:hypothetical protein